MQRSGSDLNSVALLMKASPLHRRRPYSGIVRTLISSGHRAWWPAVVCVEVQVGRVVELVVRSCRIDSLTDPEIHLTNIPFPQQLFQLAEIPFAVDYSNIAKVTRDSSLHRPSQCATSFY